MLDYGCNQGSFLRLLFELKPFHRGTGVDIALELKEMKAAFDVAFSHEVQLPDFDFGAGFSASARPYAFEGLVPIKRKNEYLPKVSDSPHYQTFENTPFGFLRNNSK